MKTLATLALLLTLAPAAHALDMPGFRAAVECDARSLHGGHPQDATTVLLGAWENGEKNFYVLSGDQVRVGLRADDVVPGADGRLQTAVLAENLDNGQWAHYGNVRLVVGGSGALDSDFDKSEPYVLGSLELTNCRKR